VTEILDEETRKLVARVTGAPDFITPWLDRFYDAGDAELVRLASGEPPDLGEIPAPRLDRAVRRAILDRRDDGSFAPSSFHDRLEIWAMLEGWKDVPAPVHERLADWEVAHYTESVREDPETDYTYLLLDEAEAVIAAEPHVYLWPCDCRAIVSRCGKPSAVCLRFNNDRGLGWEISRERAVEVLRETDAAGLMHTDYIGRSAGDPHAICNCCTDCCFPHLAAARLGIEHEWPRRRHLAVVDDDACALCGTCAGRCPFEGIAMADEASTPVVDASGCRGCGLCSTGCSAEAIAMRPLA
jgi:Pyruvate/2-oxoacid:ferredoxin oxidoreductase delta subunit